jgi:hypothetical protein
MPLDLWPRRLSASAPSKLWMSVIVGVSSE